jgi:hypothetical protein
MLGPNDLEAAAIQASAARRRGERFLEFTIEPVGAAPGRFVNLWDGVFGTVVERVYEDQRPEMGSARPAAHVLTSLRVRADCISICEAYRRQRSSGVVNSSVSSRRAQAAIDATSEVR